MKKLSILFFGISVLFLFTACDSKDTKEQAITDTSSNSSDAVKGESNDLIKEFIMKNGKVFSINIAGEEQQLEKEIVLPDGLKIFPDGKFVLIDNTSNNLQEGDKVVVSSSIVKAEQKKEDVVTKDKTTTSKDTSLIKKTTTPSLTKAVYKTYASGDFALAKNGGKVVLFFSEHSCGVCSGIDSDIRSNIGGAPKNVAILKLEYENYQEMRKRYGVLHHHTFVQVDENGSLITMWTNSGSLNDIISKIR